MTIRKNMLLLALLLGGLYGPCYSQESIPYYVSLNQIEKGKVHDITDQTLHLEYFDGVGRDPEFLFRIFDWQHVPVATLRLDKVYGLNHYTIKLDEVYGGWEADKLYTGEFRDESGNLYKLPLRNVAPPDMEGPSVDILVNPLEVNCKGLGESMIEFYGVVSGGKAPYTTSWYVLNKTKTDFLYQPRDGVMDLPGKTSVVRVDKAPEYYVVFYVKDACHKEQKKIVNMVCENNRKKINTIFVEELESPLLIPKKSQ